MWAKTLTLEVSGWPRRNNFETIQDVSLEKILLVIKCGKHKLSILGLKPLLSG